MFVKRVTFEHYRVPDWIGQIDDVLRKKGRPAVHELFRYRKGVDRWTPAARGGKTVCYVQACDGSQVRAEAVCSLSDAFSYQTGRTIAHERAVRLLLGRQP